ncbi:MAG TPA: 50S ribosomal protein L29 [Candidatus Dormibacteraeota bacterium]|nr:50S ribosomal protein L29 [Candidatus Dormibacteraeota bacterium]
MTKQTLDVQQLRDLDDLGLVEALRDRRQELLQLRLQRATGQLEQHRRIREVRRGIARVHTLIRAREIEDLAGEPG